jgi:prepilin-type processing-associated H-X9-DG protein
VRAPIATFSSIYDNSNISYFVGVEAKDNWPQSILGGDRNLSPGTQPKDDYGYASTNGLGYEARLQTNSPVCWSLKMHSQRNPAGMGNLLMADGSVYQASSLFLRTNILPFAGITNAPALAEDGSTNAAIPTPVALSASAVLPIIRLLFP